MPNSRRSLIVIPARRASVRLPDKLLLGQTGKPLLQHTIERALDAAQLASKTASDGTVRVSVVCDDPKLAEVAEHCGVQSVLVMVPCDSGTERIARAMPSLPDCDVVLNLQADEPEMPADWIVGCIEACRSESGCDVVTVAVPLTLGDAAMEDSNAVKVVLDHHSFALYFSRSPIPALRRGGTPPTPRALLHKGLYAYSANFLRTYFELPASELEQCECLEQLRFLQAGAQVKVLVRPEPAGNVRGIDTEDDYRQFVRSFRATS